MANHYSGKRVAGRKPVGKRALSLLLALALVMSLSLVQITAFAVNGESGESGETDAKQVTTPGGIAYYKADGTVGSENGWAVKLSRTLTETGTENLFNVNLEVTTKDNSVVTDAEAAAVLVLDTSGSMADCAICGVDEEHHKDNDKRTEYVYKCPNGSGDVWKDERGGFFGGDGYCDNCGEPWSKWVWNEDEGYPERVNTHIQTPEESTGHDFQSRLTAAKAAAVSFLDSYAKKDDGSFASAHRYVSIVTFARLANSKKVSNQYWVDVTSQTSLDAAKAIFSGDGIEAVGGTNTEAGLRLASNLLGQKSAVKNRFAVLLTDGLPTYYIEDHEDNKRDGLDKVPSGYKVPKYNWFEHFDHYEEHDGVTGKGYDTTKAETAPVEKISKALTGTAKIYSVVYGLTDYETNTIRKVVNGSDKKVAMDTWMKDDCGMTAVYPADSVGALNAAFRTILNTIKDESVGTTIVTAVNNMTGENALENLYTFVKFNGGANGAKANGNTVEWNLGEATAENGTYTLSYQVRMHTETTGFGARKSYSLGAATLSFTVKDDDDPKTVAFPEVAAKGYLGELNFDKVDEKGTALAGATFQLASAAKTKTVESGVNVTFTGIPSGYTYTLSETKAPDGYTGTNDTWTVTVAYGDVTVAGVEDLGNFKVENEKIPVEEPASYTVKYYVEDATGKFNQYGEDKVYKIAEGQTEATLEDLYDAFANVASGYQFNKDYTDIYNNNRTAGSVAPGAMVEVKDKDVINLYYELAPVEPEGPFTYWVKHIYMNGMLVDGGKDEYFENVEAGTKVVPAELDTYLDYTVNGVKHVYQVEKLDPAVETLITKNDQVFYIYYQRNDPTPEYITVTVTYVEKDNISNVLHNSQSKQFELVGGVAAYDVTDLKFNSLTKGGTTYSYDSADAALTGKAESNVPITLYYKAESNTPVYPPVGPTVTYYSVTVNYYDKASGESIHTPYTDSKASGSSYDVTAQDKIAITGYTYVETTGDALTGTLNGNKVINVYYSKDAEQPSTPTEPGEKPSTPTEPVQPPKTGDSMGLWAAAAVVSGMGLAWLSLSGKKRKEEV